MRACSSVMVNLYCLLLPMRQRRLRLQSGHDKYYYPSLGKYTRWQPCRNSSDFTIGKSRWLCWNNHFIIHPLEREWEGEREGGGGGDRRGEVEEEGK